MSYFKTIINPFYQQYESFVHSIHERFGHEGETIYQKRNTIKVFKVGDIYINVKQYQVPHLLNRIAYTWLRPPKATRAYNYGLKLLSKGVCTPEPVAVVLLYKNGLLHTAYFISIQVSFPYTLYILGKAPASDYEALIRALARYTATLHEKQVYHKDYSPGNILYEEVGGAYQFCLVDINRMRFKAVSVKEGCKNFARLWGKTDTFKLLAEEYALARKADPRQCVEWVLHYREQFWQQYAKRHTILFDYE